MAVEVIVAAVMTRILLLPDVVNFLQRLSLLSLSSLLVFCVSRRGGWIDLQVF